MGRFDVTADPAMDKVRVDIYNDSGDWSFFETDSATARSIAQGLLDGAAYNEHVKRNARTHF